MRHWHVQEKEHLAESPTVMQDLAISQTWCCGRKAEAMGCWLHPGVRVGMWRDTGVGDAGGGLISIGSARLALPRQLAKHQSRIWLLLLHAGHPITICSPDFELSTLLIRCLGTGLLPHGGAGLSSQRDHLGPRWLQPNLGGSVPDSPLPSAWDRVRHA